MGFLKFKSAIFVIEIVLSVSVTFHSHAVAQTQIIETAERFTIKFSNRILLQIRRGAGGGIAGIERLVVDGYEVLSMPCGHQLPSSTFEIIGEKDNNELIDWPDYLLKRQANGGNWPEFGKRTQCQVNTDSAQYLGYNTSADSVIFRFQLNDGTGEGEVRWIFFPTEVQLGENNYRGIGWQVRLIGLNRVVWLRVLEPALARTGDWVFSQLWGQWIENRVGFGDPYMVKDSWYCADIQPFYFAAGHFGAVASFFETPVAAQNHIEEDAGRHFLEFSIPFGQGDIRQTPVKYWLRVNRNFHTKWTAIDEWTIVFDALGEKYRRLFGLGLTEPKPSFIGAWPGEEYYYQYRTEGPVGVDELWLDSFRKIQLPMAAELGVKVIYILAPWESDAEYSQSEYLPGSAGQGSAHAPRSLEISTAIGGISALKKLIDRAHELDIKIILWSSPGHLSNSSQLLVKHPEWIKWRWNGTPEDFNWGDVTGTDQRSGYFDYAINQYRKIYSHAAFDGIIQDSFLTFGIFPDYSDLQPGPTLDQTLVIQREFRQMGLTEIHIEGCGPFGLSATGFGHEPPIPEDLEKIEGREYGLYRYLADEYIEPDSYYRAVASKGMMGITDLKEIADMPETSLSRIVNANHDYMLVLEKMQRRRLIGRGEQWLGVEWTQTGSNEIVLFSFEPFRYTIRNGNSVKDISDGTRLRVDGSFKTRPMHTYVITGDADDAGVQTPFRYELQQNFPNPFNPITNIEFRIAKPEFVTLKIYSLLGQEVTTLVSERLNAGSYNYSWDAAELANGLYLYELQAGEFVETKKMVLLR